MAGRRNSNRTGKGRNEDVIGPYLFFFFISAILFVLCGYIKIGGESVVNHISKLFEATGIIRDGLLWTGIFFIAFLPCILTAIFTKNMEVLFALMLMIPLGIIGEIEMSLIIPVAETWKQGLKPGWFKEFVDWILPFCEIGLLPISYMYILYLVMKWRYGPKSKTKKKTRR